MRVRRWLGPALVAAAAVLLTACGDDGGTDVEIPTGAAEMELNSTAFEDGGQIPAEFTCDGENRRPSLVWTSVPGEAKSLALVVDDPDAGNFVHWVVYGIPPGVRTPEGFEALLTNLSTQGENDFGESGYGGPCPPPGDEPHAYRFRLFALDTELALEPGAGADEVADAMEGHIVAVGELTGTFGR